MAFKKYDFFVDQSDKFRNKFTQSPKTCAQGDGMLMYGLSTGEIQIFDTQLNFLDSFHAFQGPCQFLFYQSIEEISCLISIGEELEQEMPFLKIWSLESNFQTHLIHSFPLKFAHRVFPVTCFSIEKENLVVGLETGVIFLFKGQFLKEKSLKQQILFEAGSSITGLNFFYQDSKLKIFVSTLTELFSLDITSKEVLMIEDKGSFVNTQGYLQDQLWVVKDDGLYGYGCNKRSMYPIDGLCKRLDVVGPFLLISSSFIKSSSPLTAQPTDQLPHQQLTLYYLPLNLLIYQSVHKHRTSQISTVNVLNTKQLSLIINFEDGDLIALTEIDLKSELDLLYTNQEFELALSWLTIKDLSKTTFPTHQYDVFTETHKRFGDFLYEKGEFELAMKQYIETIPHVPSSFVLLKFMDKSNELIAYLIALYHKKAMSKQHFTLLMNAFAKKGDLEQLNTFLDASEIELDEQQILKILMNYPEQLMRFAQKLKQYDVYIAVLMQHEHYESVITCLKQIQDTQQLISIIKEEGFELMKHDPEPLTLLAIDLIKTRQCKPEDFQHLFSKFDDFGIQFYEAMLQIHNDEPPSSQLKQNIIHLLLEFYLHIDQSKHQKKIYDLLSTKCFDPYHVLMLCHKCQFLPGLLAMFEELDFYEEMIQLYMSLSEDHPLFQMDRSLKKSELTNRIPANFNGKQFTLMRLCLKYGQTNPMVWILCLKFFGQQDPDLLIKVIELLDQENLFHPIEILDFLCQDTGVSIGHVFDYFQSKAKEAEFKIQENQKLISCYTQETDQILEKISSLQTKPILFQSNQCCACQLPLEPPSLHFLCYHSYHQRCLGNNAICPLCQPEYEILKSLDEPLNPDMMKTLFIEEISHLSKFEERFDKICDYFGKVL